MPKSAFGIRAHLGIVNDNSNNTCILRMMMMMAMVIMMMMMAMMMMAMVTGVTTWEALSTTLASRGSSHPVLACNAFLERPFVTY